MAVSDSPWQFPESAYSSQQWARACLIDTETGAADSKERYKLPVKEPSGVLNRNGVHAAAARINQVQGVSSEAKATAARKLVSLYSEIGETPPDSLKTVAGGGDRSAPDVERLWSTTFIKGTQGSPVEMRSREKRTIGGYAAVFDRNSENLGGFIEQVDPQFFNKAQGLGWPAVVCRFNHRDEYMLGATYSKTLRLSKDNTGLNYEVDLPECRNDVLEYVGRGDIRSSSFAFQCYEDEWRTGDGGYPIRRLMSGKLIDVAPVTVPAYPDATVGLRSLARHVGAPIEEIVARAACDELRGFFIRTDGTPKPKKPPVPGRKALMDILSKRPDDPIGKTA